MNTSPATGSEYHTIRYDHTNKLHQYMLSPSCISLNEACHDTVALLLYQHQPYVLNEESPPSNVYSEIMGHEVARMPTSAHPLQMQSPSRPSLHVDLHSISRLSVYANIRPTYREIGTLQGPYVRCYMPNDLTRCWTNQEFPCSKSN